MENFLHPSSSPLFKNVNAYLFLYLVDGEYGFLDFVNHFRLLNHAAPSLLMAGTLMNHACNRVLTEKGKNLSLHNFLLLHLRSHFQNESECFIGVSKHLATIKVNKSTRPTASCFHLFLGVWIPRWSTRSRFGNSTWIIKQISCSILRNIVWF